MGVANKPHFDPTTAPLPDTGGRHILTNKSAMADVAQLQAALEQKQQELQTAGEMGKMLVEKCEHIGRDAAERAAEHATELEWATAAHDVLRERVKELENENENLESKNDEYSSIVKEMEGEIDSMREDQQSSAGDASDAARRAKVELEIQCRDLQEQVNEFQSELDKTRQQPRACKRRNLNWRRLRRRSQRLRA